MRAIIAGADAKGGWGATAGKCGKPPALPCTYLFEEKASGGRWDRPELHRLLDHLRRGDVVVIWKLGRLSRSLKDLLHIMEKFG
jgi:hypothetical protein